MKKTIALAALVAATTAHAGFYTGNDILNRLNGPYAEKTQALYYVAGVFDTLSGVVVCAPPNVTLGQLADVMQQQLIANPATRNQPADLLIMRVFAPLWPCAQEQKGTSL